MPLQAYDAPDSRFRRSHSATSADGRRKQHVTLQTVNSDLTRQYARLAAHIAMDRSLGSTSESISREGSKRSTATQTSHGIRFAPRESRASHPSSLEDQQATRPVQRSSSSHPSTSVPPAYESMLMTSEMPAGSKIYDSQPSSYRRLKRARSMMDTRRVEERNFSIKSRGSVANFTRPLQHASSTMSLRASSLKLSLRRSLNMLRSRHPRPEKLIPYQPELTCRPESIALARSEFLKMYATPPSQSGKGSPRSPKTTPRNSARSLRRSIRAGDTSQGEIDCHIPHTDDLSPLADRSLSVSWRSKIKRVFGRSVPSRQILPLQQLDASYKHFNDGLRTPVSENVFDRYCDGDPELARRNSLYIPIGGNGKPELAGDTSLAKLSSTSSTHSLRTSSQSRTTSWNNSLSSSSAKGDAYDPKRLSVIKEDGGPHQPSSSAGRHVGGLSVFQQPLQLHQGAKIDSQRVYSALLKRIDQEQAEIENTKTALHEIHESQEEALQDRSSTATVRRVQSESSLAETYDCNDMKIASDAESEHPDVAMTSWTTRGASQRLPRQNHLREQISTFFGSSTGLEPPRSSPFRQLIRQRQYHVEQENYHTAVGANQISGAPRYRRFANSSESIYSRTTNGGTNLDYTSPFGSTENVNSRSTGEGDRHGMATIMYSSYAQPGVHSNSTTRNLTGGSMTSSEKRCWRGWIESEAKNFDDGSTQGKTHIRESAQVDPFDLGIGSLKPATSLASHPWQQPFSIAVKASTNISNPTKASTNPVVVAKNVSTVISAKQEQPIVAKADSDDKGLVETRHPLSEHVDGVAISSPYSRFGGHKPQPERKLSANHLARVLRLRRSRPMLISHPSTGKENKNDSMQHSRSQGGLEHQQSESQGAANDAILRVSKNNAKGRSNGSRTSPSEKLHGTPDLTPTDRGKAALAARLSRPFDMDVPEFNRPFDSTYLGQSSQPSSQPNTSARLSVAPRGLPLRPTKSYGGLGIPNLSISKQPCHDSGPTALPQLPENDDLEQTTSNDSFTLSSRRLVSNFLRSRRKKSQIIDKSLEVTSSSSPAFI